eukprot:3884133-Rhodomonas_salina.2
MGKTGAGGRCPPTVRRNPGRRYGSELSATTLGGSLVSEGDAPRSQRQRGRGQLRALSQPHPRADQGPGRHNLRDVPRLLTDCREN